MPITHSIYHPNRLVVAKCRGTLIDSEVFSYQKEVWADPSLAGYDELVDMDDVDKIVLPSVERIRELADLAAAMDVSGAPSKLAIVASEDLAFGLGRMYGTRREMNRKTTKQVEVFRSREKALEWLGVRKEDLQEVEARRSD